VEFLIKSLIFKNIVLGILVSVVTWELAKQTHGSLQNSIMMLHLDFMPLDEIANISLNDLRR
jgi:hypothetical protein